MADPDADVTFTKQANITPTEMIDQGKKHIEELQDALTRIVQLEEIAKKQSDVIKLNCVKDKLLAIKELLNIAEGAITNIHEAIARNDEAERYHQFSRLTIAHQKGIQTRQDAENCIGDELLTAGESDDTIVEIDPNLPVDPLDPLGPGQIVVERPPTSSPIR